MSTAYTKWTGTPGIKGTALAMVPTWAKSWGLNAAETQLLKIDAVSSMGLPLASFKHPQTGQTLYVFGDSKRLHLGRGREGWDRSAPYIFTIDESRRDGIIKGLKSLAAKILGALKEVVKGVKSVIDELKKFACEAAQSQLAQIALTATSANEASAKGQNVISNVCGTSVPPDLSQKSGIPLWLLLAGGAGVAAIILL